MKSNHTFVVLAYKESPYLEDCIKSVINQSVITNVIIATSTPNEYINKIATEYKIEVKINKEKKGIGSDFDFAIRSAKTELVTIAHQDDLYECNYVEEILKRYKKCNDPIIFFTDYYEYRDNEKIYKNINLRIKKLLLLFSKIKIFRKTKLSKRSTINIGNAICCPSVTFVNKKINYPLFECDFKCDVDWFAWEKLSRVKGSFEYINRRLMSHRIHSESTTTNIIHDNIRTKEDYEMFQKFWPKFIAKFLTRIYSNSEKSNKIKK